MTRRARGARLGTELLRMPSVDRRGGAGGVVFLAWGAVQGRSVEIAAALGGTATCMYPPATAWRPPVLVRYALSTVRTVVLLARRRPRVVVVTNPPVIPGLLALVWARLTGAVVALDSHPGAFGAKDNRVAARLLPVHRFLARRVTVSLVAAPEWQREVESWGGRAMVVHEAPGPPSGHRHPRHRPLRVLYVGTFAPDEPIGEVVAAAGLVPECELVVTGDVARCPDTVRAAAPPNVRFVGFLDPPRYQAHLEEADVVVTLTTEPDSVMRAAYEAVYAERPLVLSDWPISRELFPAALYCANDAAGLAAALHRADRELDQLDARAGAARATQLARWEEQLRELRGWLFPDGVPWPSSPTCGLPETMAG